MAARVKVTIDHRVSRQKVLRVPHRFEPLHLPFSSSGWSMRVFSAVVKVAALSVLGIGQKFALGDTITLQLVGDKNARFILQPLQQALKEALCGPGTAAALDQDVEHNSVLIYCTPEVVQLTLDPDENLIEMPLVARPGPPAAETVGEALAELAAPTPDALVGDKYAAFRQD